MKTILSCLFLLIFISARADYLVVNRSCHLKANPVSDATSLRNLKKGDSLHLLSVEQENGYYYVSTKDGNIKGWVYRTFVRRYRGRLSGQPTSLQPAGPNPSSPVPRYPASDTGMVQVRVLDVGAGLCTLIKLPGNKYIIYDAGGNKLSNGSESFKRIQEFIPPGSELELMVLSHDDADHLVAAEQVVRNYRVKKVLWSGFDRSMLTGAEPGKAYKRLKAALSETPETENVNLNERDSTITPGVGFQIGSVKITFLCGFGKPLQEWGLDDNGELVNSVSIVMKLEFAGRSILFCGDAVGRHRTGEPSQLLATEKFLVEKAASYLKSDVVIAPHHGANNGSSTAFVDKTQPEYVIFSAGHEYRHPTERTAKSYMRYTGTLKMFRTDRGDDEGDGEWDFMRINNCEDPIGDDDIQIEIRGNRSIRTFYLKPNAPCPN